MRPNFLCLGTFRAGTTWLFRVLQKHPEVFLPDEKELMFFTRHYERGIAWYEDFYSKYDGQKYAGDISPSYLSSREAPERIRKHLPGVNLVATLRNPVEQIWSLYNLWLARGYTAKSLKSLLQEKGEILDNVLYFRHLSRYLEFFEKEEILILFFEDLSNDPIQYLERLYSFLDISGLYPDNLGEAQNKGRRPKSMIIEKLVVGIGDLLRHSGLIRLKTWVNKTGFSELIKTLNTAQRGKDSPSPEIRSFISTYVSEDKAHLARLVNRDLSFWE